MAWRYALSFAGAWKPAPTCSATKNLRLGLLEALARSSPAPPTTTAVPPAPPPPPPPPVAITSSTRREEVSKLAAGGPCRVGILHFVFRRERKGRRVWSNFYILVPCERFISNRGPFCVCLGLEVVKDRDLGHLSPHLRRRRSLPTSGAAATPFPATPPSPDPLVIQKLMCRQASL
jgi:hypothetical protein